MAGEKHGFLKTGSNLFLSGALERGDHVEAVREIRFYAQIIFGRPAPLASDALIKIAQGDLPDGQTGSTPISAVVLAKARTHTAESIGQGHLVDDSADDIGLW